MRLDGMGWDGTGCGMGWDGMGRDGMGWRGGSEAPQSAVDPLRAISFRGGLGLPQLSLWDLWGWPGWTHYLAITALARGCPFSPCGDPASPQP